MAAASLEKGVAEQDSLCLEEQSRGRLTQQSVPMCVLHKGKSISIALVVQWLKEFLCVENSSVFFSHKNRFASFLYGGKGKSEHQADPWLC